MVQPGKCVVCWAPVTHQSILTCCQQPCHAACATHWKKVRPIPDCPYCLQSTPISIIEVIHPQQWKDDPKSVEEVTRIWESNPLWYGICHGYNGPVEVF